MWRRRAGSLSTDAKWHEPPAAMRGANSSQLARRLDSNGRCGRAMLFMEVSCLGEYDRPARRSCKSGRQMGTIFRQLAREWDGKAGVE